MRTRTRSGPSSARWPRTRSPSTAGPRACSTRTWRGWTTGGWTNGDPGPGYRVICTPRTSVPIWTGRTVCLRRQRLRRGLPRPLDLGPATFRGEPGPAGLAQGAAGRCDRRDVVRGYAAAYLDQVRTTSARRTTPSGRSPWAPPTVRCSTPCRPPSYRPGWDCSIRSPWSTGTGGLRRTGGGTTVGRRRTRRGRCTRSRLPGHHPASVGGDGVTFDVLDVVGKSGFGIGSAGLPAYNVLIEGFTQALDNDVVLTLKQGNVAAPSRVIDDPALHGVRPPRPSDRAFSARPAGACRPVPGLDRACH